MFRYKFGDVKSKRCSRIKKNKDIFVPVAACPEGTTDCVRFFGSPIDRKPILVVKKPKNISAQAYKNELAVWNQVYPLQKGQLIFEKDEARLLLPLLPGSNLSISLSEDLLTYCKQVRAVALAVKNFNALGLSHNDLHQDNILISPDQDDFIAYLIDFDGVSQITKFRSNNELLCLYSLIYPIPNLRRINHDNLSVDEIINLLNKEIACLELIKNKQPSYPASHDEIIQSRWNRPG